jgi:hypothetical protein
MAIPVWPSTLPQSFVRDGYRGTFDDGRERAPAEFGPAAMFLKTSAAVRPLEASIVVSRSGLAALRQFWTSDLSRGRRPFIVPDQELNGTVILNGDGQPLLDSNGNQLLATMRWLVQFADSPPKYEPYGQRWSVTMSLEILPL